MSLIIILGCQSDVELIEVKNVEVKEKDRRVCWVTYCYDMVFYKGETSLKMTIPYKLAKSVDVGAKLNIKYNPKTLEVEKYYFDDFNNE